MTENLSQLLLALGRSGEASIVVKATIALAIGLLVARFARRLPAAARHLILASTFVGLLLLPAAAVVVPQVAIEIPVTAVGSAVQTPATVPPQAATTQSAAPSITSSDASARSWALPTWPAVIRTVWAGGAILFLTWLGVALWSFDRLRRHGLPWPESRAMVSALAARSGVRQPVDVVFHEDLKAPATCGWRHATVLLPDDAREWSEADLRRALIHELEHVRRGDWALQLVARAACSIFWFHPLAWIALRQMCLEAERACDDAVLEQAESTDYAAQLVELARRLSTADAQPTLAMANRSDLSARVTAILDATQSRGRLKFIPAAVAALATLLMIVGVAPVRAVGIERARLTIIGDSTQPGSPPRRASGALDRALYEAADEGDLESVNELLAAGANVNAAISGDGSPLIGAAREGHMAIVRLLLDKGADPNMIVSGDGNPLIMAAREGHLEIVELLLSRGADVNLVAPGDENALIQASSEGHLRVVQLLITRGADVNARVWADGGWGSRNDGEWRTPLSVARRGRHDSVVAYLISAGARE